jgi:hypothetical protein
MRVSYPDEKPMGVTSKAISRALHIVVPVLAFEQLIASVLIAPKRRPSPSRKSTDHAMLGLQLYLGGIGVQELVVLYILALAIVLLKRFKDRENQRTVEPSSQAWRSIPDALVFSLATLFTRIAYRLTELSGFFTGYMLFLAHHEVFFYTLECLPVLAALGVWSVVDTEVLLDEHSSTSSFVDGYDYHELREP